MAWLDTSAGVSSAAVSGLVAPTWFTCTAAIAVFAAENSMPVAEVSRIIGKMGGFTKFAKCAWRYLKDGYAPPEAGAEFAEFVMPVSGLGSVANACG
ncbi:hypothetical protein [Streptomyces sp. ISL-11]|uniref:hypothetical protein n=1 Tax=Streptomyces sp. ISL-11 TaxID=2819174 RepID=UPI001BE64D6F|nr:hypothetical protein [Streptomyces sp. ISL-11]MBT2382013.1 hypothetical protein [Streptomyces sp. ISL-11]